MLPAVIKPLSSVIQEDFMLNDLLEDMCRDTFELYFKQNMIHIDTDLA